MYRKITAAGTPFEVVFISRDKDAKEFVEYSASMPWLSLPYCLNDQKDAVERCFNVDSVPTLVILDANGVVINADAQDAVSDDPSGFPWAPKSLREVLAGPLVDAKGAARELPSTGFVALYHSATWCGPCREFTPLLIKAYEAIRAAGGALEVVFVSSDNNEVSWLEYKDHMPWVSIPFSDKARRAALKDLCGVSGIPALVLCDAATGKVLNYSARAPVEFGRPFPEEWVSPAVLDMNADAAAITSLNGGPSLCMFTESVWAAPAFAAEAALHALIPPRDATKNGAEVEPALVIARFDGEMSTQIRRRCGLGKPTKELQVILLDLSSDGVFYTPATKPAAIEEPGCDDDSCCLPGASGVVEGYLRAFVADWRAGKLQPQRAQPDAGGDK